MTSCVNKCNEIVVRKRYTKNVKYCSNCAKFIKWEGKFCPCCGYLTRINSKHSSSRKRKNADKKYY